MTTLADFETLADAQVYSEDSYELIPPSFIRGVLDALGIYEYAMANCSTAFIDQMNAPEDFSFNPNTSVGQYVRLTVESWITDGTGSYPEGCSADNGDMSYGELFQEAYDAILEEAITTNYPFGNSTESDFIEAKGLESETLIIEDFPTTLQKITLSTTNSVDQSTTVTVQQRLSADGESWTDWEDANHIYNVKSSVITYKTSIAATTANYRQVKLVAKRNLGMSYVLSN